MPKLGSMAGLPGYAYDERLERYRSLETGRTVPRAQIEELLRGVTEVAQERMARIGAAINEGQLSDEEGILALQNEMRRTGNASASLAAGGWDRMSQADWGHMGAWMRGQNQYLMGFYQELQDPEHEWKEGEIERRAMTYADTCFARFWAKKHTIWGEDALVNWETAKDDRVCVQCSGYEAEGPQPASHFPLPGEAHNGCRCSEVPEHIAQERADAIAAMLAEGGPGSGNFGHVGVKGKYGGSSPGGGKLPSGEPKPRQGRQPKDGQETTKQQPTDQGLLVKGKDFGDDLPADLPDWRHPNPGAGSIVYADLAHRQGFDGKPQVVDSVDEFIAQGDIEIFRGVTSAAYAEQFRGGDLYATQGVHGDGIYTAVKKDTAEVFTGIARQGEVMRMALRKDAKVLDASEYEKQAPEIKKHLEEVSGRNLATAKKAVSDLWSRDDVTDEMLGNAKAKRSEIETREDYRRRVTMDMGTWAAQRGYDAVYIKRAGGDDYFIVLNRTALRVEGAK